MDNDRSFNQIASRRFVSISFVMRNFAVFHQLIENVLDLLAHFGSRVKIFQNLPKVGASVLTLLQILKDVFFADNGDLPPPRQPFTTRHELSLLTSMNRST